MITFSKHLKLFGFWLNGIKLLSKTVLISLGDGAPDRNWSVVNRL